MKLETFKDTRNLLYSTYKNIMVQKISVTLPQNVKFSCVINSTFVALLVRDGKIDKTKRELARRVNIYLYYP